MENNQESKVPYKDSAIVFRQWLIEHKRYRPSTILEYYKKILTMFNRIGTNPSVETLNAYMNLYERQYSLQYAIKAWLLSVGRKKNANHMEMFELLERSIPYKNVSHEEFIRVLSKLKKPEQRMVSIIIYHTGIRIREAVKIQEKHVIFEPEHITLRIQAKGGKMRNVVLHKEYSLMLRSFMTGLDTNYLFLEDSFKKLDKYEFERKLQYVCKNRFYAALKRAGATWSHHHLRSTKIMNCSDIGLAQKLAGHTRLTTTLRYRPIDEKLVFKEMLKDEVCKTE